MVRPPRCSYGVKYPFSSCAANHRMRVSILATPDQRRQSTALPVAPMRKEPFAIRERAPSSAADIRQTQRRKPQARKPDEISLPTPTCVHPETVNGGAVGVHESLA